jgi:Tol biopolymer transport system component
VHTHMHSMRTTRTARRTSSILLALSAVICALGVAAPAPALATVPGHNGLLLFQVEDASGSQLYTLRASSKRPVQITHGPGDAIRGDWSPDGTQIAYELDAPDSVNIALVNADGSDPRIIPSVGDQIDADPSFTPDGQHVVFEHFDPTTGDDAIWTMALDGSGRRRIATGPNGAQDPNVSPDGQTLTFVGAAAGAGEDQQALFAADMDGTDVRQLTPFTLDVAIKHDWSPDGSRIVLTDNANVDAAANVATIAADGSQLTYLTHNTTRPDSAYAGSWSPDGRWIVYRFEQNGQYGLRRMHPDGTDPQTMMPLSETRPSFIDWGSTPTATGS